jgi:hypothetical protein
VQSPSTPWELASHAGAAFLSVEKFGPVKSIQRAWFLVLMAFGHSFAQYTMWPQDSVTARVLEMVTTNSVHSVLEHE